MVQQMDEYKDEIQQERLMKPKLFSYPDIKSPIAVFDFEELENTEAMLVLCVRKAENEEYRGEHTCYVWIGPDFAISDYDESNQMDENQFVQECIKAYWGPQNVASLNIKVVHE